MTVVNQAMESMMNTTTNAIELVSDGRALEVHATGKLTTEFYEQFVPTVERQIEECGKLRILFVLRDFHGWAAGALWSDTQFELKHAKDIERLAVVGEAKWEQFMAVFCRPFTSASIRYFDHAQLDEARQWLAEE